MRRLGVLLLVAGLAGFFYASNRKAKYEAFTNDPSVVSTASLVYRWETARWLIAGTAVIGLVFTILPGKKS